MVPSYASPYAIGHRAIRDLFDGPVVVQEKIDGSQISLLLTDDMELRMRSKGAVLHVDAPDKMFAKGVEVAKGIAHRLQPGWIYRGEYLRAPKHNTLAYDRCPHNHIMLFDVEKGEGTQDYLTPAELAEEAARIGLESVPVLHLGTSQPHEVKDFLERVSVLGGQKIEGVVVKNYAKFTDDKKVMMGKFVSEAFKEVHRGEWRGSNPTQGDIVAQLIASYKTPARFAKAVQHLREAGRITDTPKDIGALINEVGADIERECAEEISKALYDHFWPSIRRGVVGVLPQWYKAQLGILT